MKEFGRFEGAGNGPEKRGPELGYADKKTG